MSNLQKSHQSNPTQTVSKTHKPENKQNTSLKSKQMMDAPETLRNEDVMAAQQQLGNQVVQRALDKNHRQREKNTDEQGNLNPKLSETIQQMRGSGNPLPDAIQKEAGARFGRGFNNVRIHVDDKADKLSRSINARAFTIGSDIFFKNGVFSPGSSAGRETLIHELTHVVQQGNSRPAGPGPLKLGAPGTAMEKEADLMGKKHAQAKNTPQPVQKPAQAVVSRKMGSAADSDSSERESQELPGSSLDSVRAHQNAPQPAAQNALAYTQGSDIQIGAGQERHLPHEAAHVVQQRQGRVATDASVQMQGEDEEVQMQGEEEEMLQAQPDAASTIQREIPEAPEMTPKMQLEAVSQEAAKLHPGPTKKESTGDKIKSGLSSAKRSIQTAVTGVDPESMQGKLQSQAGNLKKTGGIEAIEKKRAEKFKESQSYSDEADKDGKLQRVPGKDEKRVSSREKLMATISNKGSKAEDVKAAQEKLDMLHKRSKTDRLKAFFTPGASTKSFSEQAMKTRKDNLKTAAQGGDEDAFQKLKAEKAEKKAAKAEAAKNGTGAKIKGALGGLFGKAKGLIGSKLSGVAKTQADNIKTHFMGKSTESDSADKSGGGGSAQQGGGSSANANAGIGAMMEKYGELVRENQDLKQKLAKLEPKG